MLSTEARKPRLSALILVVLFGITVAQASEAFLVQGLPSLTPFIQTDMGLTKAQLGWVTSSVWAGMTVSSIPLGFFIDVFGVRRTLLSGLTLLGALAILASRSTSLWALYTCLFIAGVGFASVYPSTTKATMYWAPLSVRGTFMGIKQTGVSVGAAIAAMVLPRLALAVGWRSALATAGAIVIALGLFCYTLYREHPQERGPREAKRGKNGGSVLSTVLRSPVIWRLNIVGLFLLTCQASTTTWLILYLKTDAGYDVVLAGSVLAALQAGGMIGRLGWGAASDVLAGGRRKPVMMCIEIMMALSLAAVTALGAGTPVWAVYGLAGLLGCAVMGWVPMNTIMRAELAGKEATGTVIAVGATVGSFGSIFGPPLFGYLTDSFSSFRPAWLLLACLGVLAFLLTWTVKEARSPD